ncbi:hypothetical protein C5167_002194 [Papaver somniferum]|uniref:Uncharacterized protein n=1 Tax=Papaver somniferum TaxID=3469 RepID=A0A4Y7KYL3_PAPSO|nr:hypothetical protein C5167_002194 [Papaver somniferum]
MLKKLRKSFTSSAWPPPSSVRMLIIVDITNDIIKQTEMRWWSGDKFVKTYAGVFCDMGLDNGGVCWRR